MKQLVLTMLMCCFSIGITQAQTFSGNLTLTSQADINSFAYTAVFGQLVIDETTPGDITSLAPLSSLTVVTQSLWIRNNSALTSFAGLENLVFASTINIDGNASLVNIDALSGMNSNNNVTVQRNPLLTNINGLSGITGNVGQVQIDDNPLLSDLTGLSNITSTNVVRWFSIYDSPSLTNLNGINLTSIGGQLTIRNCDGLTNLNEFSSLTSVGTISIVGNDNLTDISGLSNASFNTSLGYGGITIQDNPLLTNIDAFSGITALNTTLDISRNASLANLDGLGNLTSAQFIQISDNDLITHVDFLSNLTSVFYLGISDNDALLNLDGCSNLTSITYNGQSLHITNNSALADACGIVSLLQTPGALFAPPSISNNGTNTSSEMDIIMACSAATITGRLYSDQSGSTCVEDGSDFPLAGRPVEAFDGVNTYTGFTDNNGDFTIYIGAAGTYTVSAPLVTGDLWMLNGCQAPSYNIPITTGNYSGNNFAFIPNGVVGCSATLNVTSPTTPCPGQTSQYCVSLTNNGTTAIPAGEKITVVGPEGLSDLHNTTSTILPGQVYTYCLSQPIGLFYTGSYDVNAAASTCSMGLNASLSQTENCAFDPNDMAVMPNGCGPNGNVGQQEELTYRVRFENIGFGTAFDVFISDILDANLDISTLRLLHSSHPVTKFQVDPGNELLIEFEGIDLRGVQFAPDNKGYVFFTISPNPNLADGTIISNDASIVFNENAPIITNTVYNTIFDAPQGVAGFDADRVCTSIDMNYDFTYTGGSTGITFNWDFGPNAVPQFSTDQNPQGINFIADGDQTVTLTVDKNGCESTISSLVSVVNATCGNNGNKVLICKNGNTICVSANAVPAFMNQGYCIGPCGAGTRNMSIDNLATTEASSFSLTAYPNPFDYSTTISFSLENQEQASISVLDASGKVVHTYNRTGSESGSQQFIELDAHQLSPGIYFIQLNTSADSKTIRLVKTK